MHIQKHKQVKTVRSTKLSRKNILRERVMTGYKRSLVMANVQVEIIVKTIEIFELNAVTFPTLVNNTPSMKYHLNERS